MGKNRADISNSKTREQMQEGLSGTESREEEGFSISLKGQDLKKMVIYSELMTPKFDG